MTATFINVYHSRKWSYDDIEQIKVKQKYVEVKDINGHYFWADRGDTIANRNAFDYFLVEEDDK